MQYYGQPNITPNAPPGGGDAKPPYLQMRKPLLPKPNAVRPSPFGGGMFGKAKQGIWDIMGKKARQTSTRPVVTPKSTAVPGEVAQTPAGTAPVQPAAAKKPYGLADFYNQMKGDLVAEKNKALGETRAGAESRGLFYGSDLTGSEGNINAQFLRSLGALDADIFGRQQEDQRARLAMAANLGWQDQMNQPPIPGPVDFGALGSIFGNTPVAAPRSGPVITPKQEYEKAGGKIKPKQPEAQ